MGILVHVSLPYSEIIVFKGEMEIFQNYNVEVMLNAPAGHMTNSAHFYSAFTRFLESMVCLLMDWVSSGVMPLYVLFW